MKPRAIDIVQPKYHPSAKPPTAPSTLKKEDVLLLLEKGKRSQTTLPDGTTAPRPAGKPGSGGAASRRRLIWLTSGGAVLIIAVFFGLQAGSRLFDQWADLTPVEVAADETEPARTTDPAAVTAPPAGNLEPAAAETPVAEPTAANPFTGTVTEQAAPAAVESPPPAATTPLKVRVLNGNGRTGSATKAATILQKAGIEVVSTGNARTYGYARTIVYYPEGKQAAAEQVANALAGYSTNVQQNAVANGYDSLVVIGAQ